MEIAEAMRSRWVMVYPARFVELSVAELMRACRITSFAFSCQPPTHALRSIPNGYGSSFPPHDKHLADLAPGSRHALAMDDPDRLVGRRLWRSTFCLALHLQAGLQDGTSRALPPGVAELL